MHHTYSTTLHSFSWSLFQSTLSCFVFSMYLSFVLHVVEISEFQMTDFCLIQKDHRREPFAKLKHVTLLCQLILWDIDLKHLLHLLKPLFGQIIGMHHSSCQYSLSTKYQCDDKQ